jgi:BlaI family transcriptional regulator, penicillinase repressor
MRRRTPGLTEQELEIMKVIWSRGAVTVRDVYEELLANRKIAYTTVMTMMGVLETKGHLKKSAAEKAYVYRPVRPKEEVIGGMVKDFVSRVFNGSAKPLLLQLIETEQVTPAEIEEIRKMLKTKEGGK